MNMQSTYQAPAFDPTLDELEALKQLELGNRPSISEAIRERVPSRLLEAGFIEQGPAGDLVVTPRGRELIRRQEG
jgi:hypothetical protein